MGIRYFAGAETGDLSELQGSSGTVSAISNTTHIGAYAYKVDGSSGVSLATFISGLNDTTSYFRCWVNVNGPPSPGAMTLVRLQDSGATVIGQIVLGITGKLGAQATGGTLVAGTHALAANTWYLVEAKYVVGSGANAVMEVRLGTTVEATSSDGTATTNADMWRAGAGQGVVAYYDDVLIRNDQYAGDGRCLARQGLAGSPTYNAWAKTGGTIDVVWSNTPYNATSYAAATGSTQQQTMLIAPFTPGIGPLDTINAVKVGAVEKLSQAGALGHGLKIRFNATDQSSVNLTTLTVTDSYVEFYPSTLPTVAQLNACEGGATQGSNAALPQIEDLWVMADFSPVWFDERPTDVPLYELLGVAAYG